MTKDKQIKLDHIHRRNGMINPAAAAAGVIGASLAITQAHALDIDSALEGSDAKPNIESGALWALAIVVLIYGAKKVLGFFGR